MRRLLALASLFALALAGTASAHSLVRSGGAVVSYLSVDATSLNDLVVRPDGNRIEFRDTAVDGGMDPGSCTPGDLDAQGFIVQVFCPAAPVRRVRVDLGDREDTVRSEVDVPTTVLGGTGADRITTGPAGDEIDGGTGADTIESGPGDDRIAARDGSPDTVGCGAGADVVDADAFDEVAATCESVTGTDGPAEPPVADLPGAPRLAVGAPVLQRAAKGGAVRIYATAGEPADLSASGFLDAAGLQLPIERLPRREVRVAGGGAVLVYRLRGREWKEARRSLRRGKRVRVRLAVVATDAAGNSRRRDAPAIRLLRGGARTFAEAARHPEPNDVDGDEVKNEVDNCPTVKNGSQTDTDADGIGDACDEDDDGDGVPDADDNCRVDANPGQENTNPADDPYGDACPPVDSDGDGVIDDDDNCDVTANPGQQDLDGDDRGDACDRDRDGDTISDEFDNCPDVYNLDYPSGQDVDGDGDLEYQSDADGDGVGTACDPDEETVVVPTPTPTPRLTASASTARRQRIAVIGAGPIVRARCNVACRVRSRLVAGGRTLAAGTARLGGPGTTYVFTRLRDRPRKAVRAKLVTSFTAGDGSRRVTRQVVRLRP